MTMPGATSRIVAYSRPTGQGITVDANQVVGTLIVSDAVVALAVPLPGARVPGSTDVIGADQGTRTITGSGTWITGTVAWSSADCSCCQTIDVDVNAGDEIASDVGCSGCGQK